MNFVTCTLFGSNYCFNCNHCSERKDGLMKWDWNIYVLHKRCAQCGKLVRADSMMFYTDNGYGRFICKQCPERENMPNIKITAEVDGKQVPLENISTETFEAIKALEKLKEIPVARLAKFGSQPRLIFKPVKDIKLNIGRIYALNLTDGNISTEWPLEKDDYWMEQYENVQSL